MTAAKKLDFISMEPTNGKESIANKAIVYGPYPESHFGMVLGINILGVGAKICSFDCGYCDLGPTHLRLNRMKTEADLPTLEQIKVSIDETFRHIHTHGPGIDTIALSGNGEPTLHPDFPEIVRLLLDARNLWIPGKPVVLFTNGANLDTRKIADAANLLERRVVKLDAGSEKAFKAINSPLSRTNLAKVISGIRRLRDVTLQSFFVQGTYDNTSTPDLEDWMEVVAMIRPTAVIIQGLQRPGAFAGLVRCEEDTLYAIASRLERRVHLKATVIP